MKTKKIMLSILDNTTEFGNVIKLDIGKHNIAKRYFKLLQPTRYQIEMALINIKDTLISTQSYWNSLAKHCNIEIVVSKTQFEAVANFIETTDVITVEQINLAYEHIIAMISNGSEKLSTTTSMIKLICTILILKEIMCCFKITHIYLEEEHLNFTI